MFESLFRHDGWGIGLIRAPLSSLLASGIPSVTWLPIADRHAFAADPFLVDEGGVLYCFFELLPYATNRGKIAYAIVDGAGDGALTIHVAIVRPYHLSYPFLLRHDGEVLCIPEAHASGRVTAYAARHFPDGWYEKHVLIEDFPSLDTTIFQHDGRWWMLATDARAGWNSELHLWYADELFGHWRPHAGNPVKRDLAGTRPAGRPFVIDDRLYRPAQDCTIRYGRRLIVNEILELSPQRFSERAISVIEPDPGGPFAHGFHTANACRDVIAVDGNHLHFVPEQAVRTLVEGVRGVARRTLVRSRVL